jgi:hypothetical protein
MRRDRAKKQSQSAAVWATRGGELGVTHCTGAVCLFFPPLPAKGYDAYDVVQRKKRNLV